MHAPPHFASFVSMQHDRWNAGITAHGATRCRLTVAQRHAITASLVRDIVLRRALLGSAARPWVTSTVQRVGEDVVPEQLRLRSLTRCGIE